ncbi:hypothetical protein BDW62DRAFT_196241 [Aspergillus aurantiobrunneus]
MTTYSYTPYYRWGRGCSETLMGDGTHWRRPQATPSKISVQRPSARGLPRFDPYLVPVNYRY